MTRSALRRMLLGALIVAAGACSNDDEGFAPIDSPIVGPWGATSFMVNGTDLVPGGLVFDLSFDDEGFYDIFAQNDDLGIACEGGVTNCSVSGEFALTATQVTFDPGEPDEVTFSYDVSGDELTLSGTLGGFALSGVFVRGT